MAETKIQPENANIPSAMLDNWLTVAKKDNHALFAELNVLLKALDRYFIQDNHPTSKLRFSARNLLPEMITVRDGINRILSLIEVIMPESNRNAYWFQKFAESKLLSNKRRDRMRAGMYTQDTPEKSFYVLYDTLINMKSLVTDVIKTQDIHYMSFKNFGDFVSKEIRENVYFNPFKSDINPEYDYIENREISEFVKRIKDKQAKKVVSILLVYLFRILRYLKVMDHRSLIVSNINCSMLIFSLIKSEIEGFRSYIELSSRSIEDKDVRMLIESLAYQFGMESKRVFNQELKDIYVKENPIQMRGKIESSRGIMKNLGEQTIIQIAKYWLPDISGEDIFEVFITKTAQSMKLREDVYILNRLISEALKEDTTEGLNAMLDILLNYMEYFENFTFKLLRYDDYEHFSGVFDKLREYRKSGDKPRKILDLSHQFNVFLDTTLGQIEQRADLKERPLDTAKAEEIVRQYLATK